MLDEPTLLEVLTEAADELDAIIDQKGHTAHTRHLRDRAYAVIAREKRNRFGPFQIPYIAERAYRRGYHQSIATAVYMLEAGVTLRQLQAWEHEVSAWRNALSPNKSENTVPEQYMPKDILRLLRSKR